MEFNLKLNGKTLLGLALLSTSLVVADYVSVANVKSNGGIKVIGDTTEDTIETMMPVGSVVFRMDNLDPATIYGGTWTRITEDATISFANGTDVGEIIGSNDPVVPVPYHDHETSVSTNGAHTHTRGTMNITGRFRANAFLDAVGKVWGDGAMSVESSTNPRHSGGGGTSNAQAVYKLNAASSWSGNTSSAGGHSHTVDIQPSGTSNVTMDVRGKRLKMNVWKRTL